MIGFFLKWEWDRAYVARIYCEYSFIFCKFSVAVRPLRLNLLAISPLLLLIRTQAIFVVEMSASVNT